MSRNKDLVKNTTFITIGSLGGSLVGFLMLPLYTRWLTPADYGVTDIISTYSSLLLFVVSLSISEAIFVFPVGQSKQNITKYYTTGWYFLLACLAASAAIFFALSKFDSESSFFKYIWLIYASLVSAILLRYSQDFCRGIKKMSVFSFTGIIHSSTIALFSFLLIPKWGVNGYVIASVLSSLCSAIFSFVYSKSYQFVSFKAFDRIYLKEMLKYSLPLVPTSLMWWVVSSLNRPLLEKYVGLFAIGLFAIANRLPSILNMVFGFFQKAWQVTVVEEYQSKDFEVYYNKMFRVIFSVQVLLTIIITLFSKLFVNVMTTEEYYAAWKYIPMLSLSVLFSNTSAFCGTIFNASRRTKFTFYSVIIGSVIAVIANFILIPWIGLLGACIAICISHIASMVSRIMFSSKLVRFNNTIYVVLQMLVCSIVYAGVLSENMYLIITSSILSLGLYYYTNKNELKSMSSIILSRLPNKRIKGDK